MRVAPTRGFIVVAVLWILAALATLASIMAVYVINTATAFTVHDERLQADALTRAALELSVYQVAVNPQSPPTSGSVVFRLGNASVTADFVSESARIDLNAAPRELFVGLFLGLGAAPGPANAYADRIVGWRAPAEAGKPDEAGYYRAAGLPYGPRGGPFQHAGELSLVMGIPDLMVERALPFVTVYSGAAQINILDAAPQVLAALPGMDPSRLGDLLAQRSRGTQNGDALLAMLGPAQPLGTIRGSKAMRVTARIAFDSGQRMVTEVVVFMLDSGTEPYRVLTWREDAESVRAGGS